jgi:uncharacterized protein with NRDE domain
MCTVTYIRDNNKVFLTSNRDEKSLRPFAIAPKLYHFSSGDIFFPKDTHAGGTWIAMHENGNSMVLLNGAFNKHEPAYPYRKSRGLIFLDIMEEGSPANKFNSILLDNIEPFTLVMLENDLLFEARWDGDKKYFKQLNESQAYIWSSSTLYDQEVIARRKNWFYNWLQQQKEITAESILHFHQFTGDGDNHNDLRMNRSGIMLTVSVTGMEITAAKGRMRYLDLQQNHSYLQEFNFASIGNNS